MEQPLTAAPIPYYVTEDINHHELLERCIVINKGHGLINQPVKVGDLDLDTV